MDVAASCAIIKSLACRAVRLLMDSNDNGADLQSRRLFCVDLDARGL